MPRKFDCVIMNPPYQAPTNNRGSGHTLWDKFVTKSIDIAKPNGFIVAIHPSGWRGSGKAFDSAKIIKEKQIEYLEIHSESDGLKTFGATTRYDWYVLKNAIHNHPTTIFDQRGETCTINIGNIPFIPNYMIEDVYALVARNSEESVNILYSRSDYGSDKSWIQEKPNDMFKYPIIYSTPIRGPTIWYSSTKQNGHFGVPKLIINPCRPIGFFVDYDGKYGMSQFCVGIVGDRKYLDMVATVIANQKTNGFGDFMEACHFTDKIFNKDAISMFRKNFWEKFL